MEPAAPFPATDGDTWTGPWPDREWLIPGGLPVGRLGMLSGRGGRGKSRLALQLAARGPFVPAARGPGNATAVSDANLALDATHAGPVVYASLHARVRDSDRACLQQRRYRSQGRAQTIPNDHNSASGPDYRNRVAGQARLRCGAHLWRAGRERHHRQGAGRRQPR